MFPSAAAAPGERRGVSAGGGPVPGREEEGGGRGEPVLAVRPGGLGDQLPVEGRASHGRGELLQGESKVLRSTLVEFFLYHQPQFAVQQSQLMGPSSLA